RYWSRTKREKALSMTEHTLTAMRLGGIYDHAGGGFHRYATDDKWTVPHFEKMLYDQALLAMAYTEAFQATGNPLFGETARAVLRYVLRDLAAPDGGFCCGEDADSEGEEGRFYLWTYEELANHFPKEALGLFRSLFAVEERGNFTDEATGKKRRENILYARRTKDGETPLLGLRDREKQWVETLLDSLRRKREERERPRRDDKVLTDWNGLMIAALALGGRVFDDHAFTAAARDGAAFILEVLSPAPGVLLHRYREGESAISGLLDDYAFLGWGLLELYETTYDPLYLREAVRLTDTVLRDFRDTGRGDFYFNSLENSDLPARQKDAADGALPSGTAVTILNLARLGLFLGRTDLLDGAHGALSALSETLGRSPVGHTMSLAAMGSLLFPSFQAVVAGRRRNDREVEAFLRPLRSRFLPHGAVLFLSPEKPFQEVTAVAPWLSQMALPGEGAVLYPCSGGACRFPIHSVPELEAFLEAEGRPDGTSL
ncbi:MAG TPA: thioredoxin domain-containing protein, partial [Syntrophales bacterium]|nr:thioredoxin domain-containing protein [Syntrophales bacterium]